MAPLGTPDNPLRVAIVGSGPAGFYTAEHLLKPDELSVEVDMFDRLPTPFGLVRAGVAPDHPKIKSVIRVYEKTAAREGFRFFGNVEVGRDVTVAELAERYNAIIYAYGTATDRRLGIPGEDLTGSHAATEFVNWYNAHPDFAGRTFDLSAKRAVVIGNGNVAADVARMLALPRGELESTDTADHAIEALAASGVEEIVVLGRRGPAQAAFTNPEVRELGELTDADIVIDPAEMELDQASREYIDSEDADPTHRRNVEIFTAFSERDPEGKPKRVVMRFCRSPVEIRGEGRVESIVVGRNELYRDESGAIRARDTGEREEIECGLVLRSIGYKGIDARGRPVRRRAWVDPQRRRAGHRPRQRRAGRRPLRGRLDQARSVGRDRHQQEGRPRDRQQHLRRPRGRTRSRPRPRLRLRACRGLTRVEHCLRSRNCSPSARVTTSPTSAGRRSTAPRSPPASHTAAPGSSSAPSTRWSRPRDRPTTSPASSRRSACASRARRRSRACAVVPAVADLSELKAMIERALPGAEVEIVDEGGGDHLRAIVSAPQFEGISADRPAPARRERPSRSASTTAQIHALSISTSLPA